MSFLQLLTEATNDISKQRNSLDAHSVEQQLAQPIVVQLACLQSHGMNNTISL